MQTKIITDRQVNTTLYTGFITNFLDLQKILNNLLKDRATLKNLPENTPEKHVKFSDVIYVQSEYFKHAMTIKNLHTIDQLILKVKYLIAEFIDAI